MKKHHITLPMITALIGMLIMAIPLLISPVVGYGDDGSFAQPMRSVGLYKLDRNETDQYGSYFASQYGQYQYYNEQAEAYPTSHYPFLAAAKALNNALTGANDRFDIRFYAALLILYAGVGIYLLTEYMQHMFASLAEKIAAAVMCLFMFTDAAYFLNFNSFYPDGLALVSLLCALACLLLLTQRRYSPWWLAAGFVFNALILTGSKSANTPLGVMLGLVCLALAASRTWRTRTDHPAYQRDSLMPRLLVGAGVLCILGSAAFQFVLPANTDAVSRYHTMTRGVLMVSDNPEETLTNQRIDTQFSLLNGTSTYDRYPPVDMENNALRNEFLDRYSLVSIASYYVEHPGKLLSVVNEGAQDMYRIRPTGVGNYRREAGLTPDIQFTALSLHSGLKQSIFPHTSGFLLLWVIITVALSWRNKPRTIVLAGIAGIVLMQFIIPVLLGGNTIFERYMIVFNVAFDVVNFVGAATGLAYVIRKVAGIMTVRSADKAGTPPLEEQQQAG